MFTVSAYRVSGISRTHSPSAFNQKGVVFFFKIISEHSFLLHLYFCCLQNCKKNTLTHTLAVFSPTSAAGCAGSDHFWSFSLLGK